MSTLFVTNRTGDEFEVFYACKTYVFKCDEPVEVPAHMAKEIFGHGEVNKEQCLAHLGWIRLHSELKQGLEKLSKVEISDSPSQTDRSLPSAVGVVPLQIERRAGGRNHARGS